MPHLCENNLTASVSLMLRHFPYSSRIEPGGMTASCDLDVMSRWIIVILTSDLCGGMLTGSEVPDQKSVIRFLLTMSRSALPRSSLEEERPRALERPGRDTWMGALTTSQPATQGHLYIECFLWSLALDTLYLCCGFNNPYFLPLPPESQMKRYVSN